MIACPPGRSQPRERRPPHFLDRSSLETVAGALRLDEAERAHLFDLGRASNDRTAGRRSSPVRLTIRPSIAWMIAAMTGAAAFVVNGRQDILAVNHLGRAFFAPMFESPAPANMARFTYLDPRAKDFFADWDRAAKECVAALRTQAGRDPFDRGLFDLVSGVLPAKADGGGGSASRPGQRAASPTRRVTPQTGRTFSACGPFCPWVASNSTFWFSSNDL